MSTRLPEFANPLLSEDMSRESFQFCRLPYSSMPGWTYEDEPVVKAALNLWAPLWRLQQVSCLSLLAPPSQNPLNSLFFNYHHSRYTHVFDVARCSETVAVNNNLDPHAVSLAIHAGWLHDIATPALGDPVMYLDKVHLNEEDHWRQVLDQKHLKYLAGQNLGQDELDDVVHNKGVLGQILDITDRIVYVAADTYATSIFGPKESPQTHAIITDDPLLADIYQEIRIDPETSRVYFTDPARLGRFLKLRALLTQQVYTAPYNQARDSIVAKLLRPLYSANNSDPDKLTPDILRRMSDRELLAKLHEHYDIGHRELDGYSGFNLLTWNFLRMVPYYQKFPSRQEADQFAAGAREQFKYVDKTKAVLATRSLKGFNTATNYLVKDQGRIVPFSQVDPYTTGAIDYIASLVPGHYVYWADFSMMVGDGEKMRQALLSAS